MKNVVVITSLDQWPLKNKMFLPVTSWLMMMPEPIITAKLLQHAPLRSLWGDALIYHRTHPGCLWTHAKQKTPKKIQRCRPAQALNPERGFPTTKSILQSDRHLAHR
jgi:hypothetical protein